MTGDEERLLKAYLGLDGEDFERWYELRHQSLALDSAYKRTLDRAQDWSKFRLAPDLPSAKIRR